jgi:hypothetical protein
MRKINPQKKIQKLRTEEEMRMALYDFRIGQPKLNIDIDDTDTVFSDVIEELLEKRQMIEEIRGFVQTWAPKFARR